MTLGVMRGRLVASPVAYHGVGASVGDDRDTSVADSADRERAIAADESRWQASREQLREMAGGFCDPDERSDDIADEDGPGVNPGEWHLISVFDSTTFEELWSPSKLLGELDFRVDGSKSNARGQFLPGGEFGGDVVVCPTEFTAFAFVS